MSKVDAEFEHMHISGTPDEMVSQLTSKIEKAFADSCKLNGKDVSDAAYFRTYMFANMAKLLLDLTMLINAVDNLIEDAERSKT